MCVGTYLPFQTTYYLNGHNFMEIELRRHGAAFRKDDNAFLSTSDPKAVQAAADKLSASIIEKRLNYWSCLLCPTAGTLSSNGTSRSTRSSNTPARWDSSAWPPTRWPTSSGCVSPNGYAANCTACSTNSTTAIT